MNAIAHGSWFSGENLAARTVTFACEGTQLHVHGLDAPFAVPLSSVRVSDRLGATARFLYLPRGASIETLDNDLVDAWLATDTRERAAALIHWLEQRSPVAAVATILLVATVTLLTYFGLPWAARKAAFAVPDRVEREAGKAGLAALQQLLGESQLGLHERQRAIAQMERIARARGFTVQPQLEFRSMGKFPNAFALPGGFIVVSDELLRLANDDELAAVLAHETGHWQLRHGTQSVFHNSAALLVVSTVTGDLSTLTTFASTLPLLLLQRGYSRGFEAEADAYAVETLRRARIDARYLATILTKLERSRPDKGADYSYLSTHPSTDDRARKIDPTNTYLRLIPDGSGRAIVTASTEGMAVVESVEVAPRALTQVAPDYPVPMRTANIQGSVTVEFIVAKDGTVREPRIVRSTRREFEEPVLVAIRQWSFEPGRRHGQPVNARAQIDVPFTLSSDDEIAPAVASSSARTVEELIARHQVPTVLTQSAPHFPDELLAARAGGRVVVEFQVGNTGRVRRSKVKSSTNPACDRAALDAVRQWTFTATPDADPRVLTTFEAEIEFRITSSAAKPPAGEAIVHFDPPVGKPDR